jgi:ornithine cyclodeaminase/alanine dehydrogenase
MPLDESTLLLTRRDVVALLTLDESIAALERAFALSPPPTGVLGIPAGEGGFHIKAGILALERPYFVAKLNGNFSQNPGRWGIPAIHGVIVLSDAENGRPLAVMDSMEITVLRTGAATAVAARRLARAESRVATVCGCGNQGRVQIRALSRVLRLDRVFAFDLDEDAAKRFVQDLSSELGIELESVRHPRRASRESDVVVTCTPSREPFLSRDDVAPGTFVAAVGADSPEKQELEPALLAGSKLVVDNLEQAASFGELHHALSGGFLRREAVHAELADVVAGRKPGRTSPEEITVFDSTGVALEDAAAAAAVFEKARRECGARLRFSD